jgi:hypothetical protein
MVKKLDVAPPSPPPHPNIQLTVYLVFGSPQSSGDQVPQELDSTIKQLHTSFAYKSYRMADSFVLRARDGQIASTSGVISVAVRGRGNYSFSYTRASVSTGVPNIIRIDGLLMTLRVEIRRPEVPPDVLNSEIRTSVDVGEGQKIVVGKSNVNGTEEALILIITAKVVE